MAAVKRICERLLEGPVLMLSPIGISTCTAFFFSVKTTDHAAGGNSRFGPSAPRLLRPTFSTSIVNAILFAFVAAQFACRLISGYLR
jgi:hypothetical protein